jgi:hypothetical protein
LTEDNLRALEKYTHYAPKTTFELWMIDNVSGPIEKCFPEAWTPNVITLIGNSVVPVVACVFLSQVGAKMTDAEPIPSHLFMLAGFSVFWFS